MIIATLRAVELFRFKNRLKPAKIGVFCLYTGYNTVNAVGYRQKNPILVGFRRFLNLESSTARRVAVIT